MSLKQRDPPFRIVGNKNLPPFQTVALLTFESFFFIMVAQIQINIFGNGNPSGRVINIQFPRLRSFAICTYFLQYFYAGGGALFMHNQLPLSPFWPRKLTIFCNFSHHVMEQAHCNLQTKHHMKSNVNIVIFCVYCLLSFNRPTEKGNLQAYFKPIYFICLKILPMKCN